MAIHTAFENLSFIHIPKCAGKSIRTWLCQSVPMYKREIAKGIIVYPPATIPTNHLKYRDEEDILEKRITFAVVRNPWARMVSMYFYFKQKHDSDPRSATSGIREELDKGFENFLVNDEQWSRPDYLFDQGAWHPTRDDQTSWIVGERSSVDIVLQQEHLREGLERHIRPLIESKVQLPMINKSQHKHYRDYYNTNTRRLVGNRFSRDIETYKYIF